MNGCYLFCDNKAISLRNDLSEEMKRALDDAKASEERDALRDSVFCYQHSFFESGSTWEEDHWSKRLYHGLERYLPTDLLGGKYKVNYVAKDGKQFQRMIQIYLFLEGHLTYSLLICGMVMIPQQQ